MPPLFSLSRPHIHLVALSLLAIAAACTSFTADDSQSTTGGDGGPGSGQPNDGGSLDDGGISSILQDAGRKDCPGNVIFLDKFETEKLDPRWLPIGVAPTLDVTEGRQAPSLGMKHLAIPSPTGSASSLVQTSLPLSGPAQVCAEFDALFETELGPISPPAFAEIFVLGNIFIEGRQGTMRGGSVDKDSVDLPDFNMGAWNHVVVSVDLTRNPPTVVFVINDGNPHPPIEGAPFPAQPLVRAGLELRGPVLETELHLDNVRLTISPP